jgi:hypothetical protein
MRVNPSALSAIVAILGYTAVVFFAFAIGLTNEHSAALTNEQGMRVHVVAIKGIHGDL